MPLREPGRSILRLTLLTVGLVVTGVTVAAVAIAYGEYAEKHWVPPQRWVGLVAHTLLIFGALLREFRRSWFRLSFWATTTGLLALHLAAYATVLTLVPEWRLVWFLPITVLELPVLTSLLFGFGYRSGGRSKRRRRTATRSLVAPRS